MQCYNCDSKRLKYNAERDAYICLDCHYEYPKQYFFISHSHLDIEKVRIVRNIVEETFFYEPILFFLKCLSEESEINNLIRREIRERVWFIYCKSENAEKSKFVSEERRYIEQLIKEGDPKKILTIDLDRFEIWDDECLDDLRRQVSYKIRKAKIFLSGEHKDIAIASVLHDRLCRSGYDVWWDRDLSVSSIWMDEIEQKIKERSYKDGLFLPIFTGETLSRAMLAEVERAHQNNALIMPIVTDPRALASVPPYVKEVQPFFVDVNDLEHSADLLVKALDEM